MLYCISVNMPMFCMHSIMITIYMHLYIHWPIAFHLVVVPSRLGDCSYMWVATVSYLTRIYTLCSAQGLLCIYIIFVGHVSITSEHIDIH